MIVTALYVVTYANVSYLCVWQSNRLRRRRMGLATLAKANRHVRIRGKSVIVVGLVVYRALSRPEVT